MPLFVVRALAATGCDRMRQRKPITKAGFRPGVAGMPSAPSPADRFLAGNGVQMAVVMWLKYPVLIGRKVEIGPVDPHAMEDNPIPLTIEPQPV